MHAPASGAERFAHGELALAAVGAHENEVGDVRARDEEHEPGGRGDDPQRARDAARDVLAQRNEERPRLRLLEQHRRRNARREIREQLDDARQHRREIALRVRDGHAGLETRDAVVVEAARVTDVRIELQRQPDLRRGRGKAKALPASRR